MINEISVKVPEKLRITKTTTSFDNNFYQLSINNIFEAAKFEPDPTFENTITKIKENYLKSIASAATNTSAITYFDKNSDQICINNRFEAATLEPERSFEKTTNDIKIII